MAERSARGAGAGMAETGLSATAVVPPLTGERHDHSTAGMIRAGTGQALDEAKNMVRDAADQQRKKAAETVGGVAEALHRTAGSMEAENTTMAHYTEVAASRLDDVARYLRQNNWGDLVEGAESFARRQPAWFIGGAMATGFLLARLVKSSPEAARTRGEFSTSTTGLSTGTAGLTTTTTTPTTGTSGLARGDLPRGDIQ